jgi:hypothetical protein
MIDSKEGYFILELSDVKDARTCDGVYTFTRDCEMCIIATNKLGRWYGSHIGDHLQSEYEGKDINPNLSKEAQFQTYLILLLEDGVEIKKYNSVAQALEDWSDGYDPSEA